MLPSQLDHDLGSKVVWSSAENRKRGREQPPSQTILDLDPLLKKLLAMVGGLYIAFTCMCSSTQRQVNLCECQDPNNLIGRTGSLKVCSQETLSLKSFFFFLFCPNGGPTHLSRTGIR